MPPDETHSSRGGMPLASDGMDKSCRSCVDFRSWMKKKAPDSKDLGKPQGNASTENGSSAKSNGGESQSINSKKDVKMKKLDDETELWGRAARDGCPADSESLGRGSWTLLHTMAAQYPDKPSEGKQKDMKAFIRLFSTFYPCPPCAEDFRHWLKENPPEVGSGHLLSQFFCKAHNEVNRKLGKDEFDCRLVDKRWKHGWEDGSCG